MSATPTPQPIAAPELAQVEAMREEFESFLLRALKLEHRGPLLRFSDGAYFFNHVDLAWQAWQAVSAKASQRHALESAPRWIRVEERLPVAGLKVLVCYRNSLGLVRRTCAHHAPLHTIDASHWEDGTDDTEDGAFEPEGWWEDPVEVESMEFIHDTVTHWMPLPVPPADHFPDAGKVVATADSEVQR